MPKRTHLVRINDDTYRKVVEAQLEHVRKHGVRLSLGDVIEKLVHGYVRRNVK